MLAFWRELRENLTGADSIDYWRRVDGALVPGGFDGIAKFAGKLVSASPETNPIELMIAVDGAAADAKIELIEALPGRMPAGREIRFAGTAKEFTKSPYLLTLESDTVDLEGWRGE